MNPGSLTQEPTFKHFATLSPEILKELQFLKVIQIALNLAEGADTVQMEI